MLIGPWALTTLGAATAAVAMLALVRNLRRVATADLILFHIDFLPGWRATLFVDVMDVPDRLPIRALVAFLSMERDCSSWPDPSPGTRVRL